MIWMYSKQRSCFWNRCNTAWLLCGQPSSDHAMATVAIQSSGAQIACDLVATIPNHHSHQKLLVFCLCIFSLLHWWKGLVHCRQQGAAGCQLKFPLLVFMLCLINILIYSSVQYASDRGNTSLNQQLQRFPNICGESKAYTTFHTPYI